MEESITIEQSITALTDLESEHLKIGEAMLKAYDDAIYAMDLFASGVLNRSLSLIAGFKTQIECNFICAAPIVRLQLDNLLRFNAAFHVDDPHRFVVEVMNGAAIRDLHDRSGKRMTDRHLVDLMSESIPQIRQNYEVCCIYVHLSDRHIYHAVQIAEEGALSIEIGGEERFVSDELRLNASMAMVTISHELLRFVYGWAYTKGNPERCTKPFQFAERMLREEKPDEAASALRSVVHGHYDPEAVSRATHCLSQLESGVSVEQCLVALKAA